MNTIIGLSVIAIGSICQSSSYVPIKKIEGWTWECFWLLQGVFAWLVFPTIGAILATPNIYCLIDVLLIDMGAVIKTMLYGVLWGVGGLTFGLSMRYLGVALGQSLSLGTCSGFGTLIPAVLKGDNLLEGDGLILLIGVSIAIAGIAIIGYAGSLKSKEVGQAERKQAIKEFALKKGILIALLAGLMSACFNLGLEAGTPIHQKVLELGTNSLLALNPVILLVTTGGFITNAIFCFYQNHKNKTFTLYSNISRKAFIQNITLCALAGLLWYSQFFGLGAGRSFLENNAVMMALSWSILMSLNVLFSNIWGIILNEWKGVQRKTIVILVLGLFVLLLSVLFPQLI